MGSKRTDRLTADEAGMARAAAILRAGGLVAVPTETVYGLAARADQEKAVAGIYRAKGRPDFNPLIVHVGSREQARQIAMWGDQAEQLAARFWPGPLTLVLPLRAGSGIVPAATAGLPTIALRIPDHPAMQALLADLNLPLAAPSANRSGAVSPTCAEHVTVSLGGRIDAILDAGPTTQGLESTIVALRPGGWQVLRPGPISEGEIAELLGPPLAGNDGSIEAPGQLASHYSPGKPVRLDAESSRSDEFMIGFGAVAGDCNLAADGDLAQAAARLYACLHEAGQSRHPSIAVARIPDHGMGAAINDRLRRAAA
ncbi:MAG: L-threonylcarbamoyladenylate synthase [Croceibacterium sp.]